MALLLPNYRQVVQKVPAVLLEVGLQIPRQVLILADLLPLDLVPQVELPKRGDRYALGRKLPAEERSPFLESSASPEFEGPFAFEEVDMDLVELAGKVYWPASLLRKGLSADVLNLVVG